MGTPTNEVQKGRLSCTGGAHDWGWVNLSLTQVSPVWHVPASIFPDLREPLIGDKMVLRIFPWCSLVAGVLIDNDRLLHSNTWVLGVAGDDLD